MKVTVIQALRNDHIHNQAIYPVVTEQMDYAIGDFIAKYKYIPSYVYQLIGLSNITYVAVDKDYVGDGKENKIEQLYDIFTLPIEKEKDGLDLGYVN